jgi:hypothetical protein
VSRPAVFLDRDGTLIEERGYPTTTHDIVPLPGAGAALARLGAAGWHASCSPINPPWRAGCSGGAGACCLDLQRKLGAERRLRRALPARLPGGRARWAIPCDCRKQAAACWIWRSRGLT